MRCSEKPASRARAIIGLAVTGECDQERRTRTKLLADAARDGVAVHVGEADVDDRHVRRTRNHGLHCRLSVASDRYLMSEQSKHLAEHLAYDQAAGARTASGSRPVSERLE
jgi:hypothetical protein